MGVVGAVIGLVFSVASYVVSKRQMKKNAKNS